MSNLYDQNEKTNLVIRADGGKAFNDHIEMFEDRIGHQGHEVTPWSELPIPIEKEYAETYLPELDGWLIPPNFCAKCEKTDVVPKKDKHGNLRIPTANIVPIFKPSPEIDLVPGDYILTFTCYDCVKKREEISRSGLVRADGSRFSDPTALDAQLYFIRVRDYIKALKLKGETKRMGSKRNWSGM